jgi:BspA type Leucine rich repeat region (6 copies)/Listeria-Bacteroides repeat domain (List_Bact_rpt)
MKLQAVAKTLISILVFIFVAQPLSAFAAFGTSSVSKTYVPFGSQITLYGSNLELADRIVISDSAISPTFRYTGASFSHISSEEILITLPLRTEINPSAPDDSWYQITAYSNSSGDASYLSIFLYSPQPYDGNDGKVNCSIDGYVTIASNVANAKNSCIGNLTLPEGVTSIQTDLFYADTGLRSLRIPNSLLTIGIQSFYQNTNLTSITFGSNLTTIGNFAFYGTRVTSLNIPPSVTSIGMQSFGDISTLKSVDYCWPSGIHASDVVWDLQYVNLICSNRTTINVTNTASSGSGSLKDAIDQINSSPEEESFTVNMSAGIYNISDGLPEITRDVEIKGQGDTTILNLVAFGTDPLNKVLFRTGRTSVDLVLSGLKIQGAMTAGTLVRNQNGYVLIKNTIFTNITNSGGEPIIDSYSGLDERAFSVTKNSGVEFKDISGSCIFYSDYGFTPSTTTTDSDYNNRIYIENSVFDNVESLAQVQRFLKIDHSIFRNSASTSIATGNNRFQLLNSTFENIVSLNLSTAWNPVTDYSTRSGDQVSLSAAEKVVSGNTFKSVTSASPFISVNTDYWNVGLLTFTDNNFEFISNLSRKSPELSDVLNYATNFTSETIFTGNQYFYPSTIIFDGNGSTSGSMSASFGIKSSNLPINQFAKNGFNFNSWNTQADGLGTQFVNSGSYTYGTDQTLYAIWTKTPVNENTTSSGSSNSEAEAAKKAQELQQLLTVLPSIGNLALEIGNLIESLTTQKCVKGKVFKKVKAGAKCPKGYKVKN